MPSKKPSLKVVGSPAEPFDPPPRPLGEHGLSLWQSIIRDYRFDDAPGRETLYAVCAALDTAEACAAEVRADGPVIRTKAGIKEHPALRAELANRSFIVRTLARLGLDLEPIKAIGRPPMKSYPQ
jgi:hypothetical protein